MTPVSVLLPHLLVLVIIENNIKVKNQIEAKCKKQATAEVLEVELHSIIQQKCDNKKYEWRRARESLRTRLFAWFVLVFGIACFALLDPRKFAFTGMILMFLGKPIELRA